MMADQLVRTLARTVRDRKFYGLIADETADISRMEQLAICLCSVSDDLIVDENLLGFYAMEKCNGESIYNAVADVLLRLEIDLADCCAVTFDGASSFSSQAVGVAGRICAVAKRAVHTHCHMHCVNLAVQDALTAVSFMRDFLNFIHDLIVFLRNSPKRCATIRQIATDHARTQTNIRPVCPTRFTVRYRAIESVKQQLVVIVEALDTFSQDSNDASISSTARGYLKRLMDFEFYISLTFAMPVFEITDRLSTQLQAKTVSTGQGVALVHHAVVELTKLRAEDKFNELWDAAESWRCSMNADQPKLPRHMGASARFQSSQPHKFATPKDMYRAKYFEIIDTAVGRLNFRITNKAVTVLIATENLLQAGWQSTTIHDDDLNTVCSQNPDLDRVRLAAQLLGLDNLRHSCQVKTSGTTASFNEEIISLIGSSILKGMIPEVVSLIKFYLVCPATSASAERSFSQLRRLKTYLRGTMSQKRRNSLLMLSTYTNELDLLDMRLLVNDFITRNDYRRSKFALFQSCRP